MSSMNKFFSSKQESMVAKYMSWKVVTGSGSRPFAPGDVNSYNFLVECKTHNEEQDNIVFHKKHWKKITEEARAKYKYPVLVVDNGTQKAGNTWVMIPKKMLSGDSVFKIYGLENTSRTGNTITFNNLSALSLYKTGHQDNRINYFPEWFDDEQVAIMSLEEFKTFCQEEFGC